MFLPSNLYNSNRNSNIFIFNRPILNICNYDLYSVHKIAIKLNCKIYKSIVKQKNILPLNNRITHVDFFSIISTNSSLLTEVNIILLNKNQCPGIKDGGICILMKRKILVKCIYSHIPNKIFIDLSIMNKGDNIYVGDILSSNFYILSKKNIVLLKIIEKK